MPVDPTKPYDLVYRSTPTYCEIRLDNFVKAMVPSMSRTKIQKHIKAGRVSVNGETHRANWIVRLNDEVILHCEEPSPEVIEEAQNLPLDVIYEDDHIIAINKQANLVVHPVGIHRHKTLLNALYWRYKDKLPPEQEISLANRLDQYTSGVILVAKDTDSKRCLQDQFENRKTAKMYHAICAGLVEPDEGEINEPIGSGDGEIRTSMMVRHDEQGKPSQTCFKVLERFACDNMPAGGFTLVQLEPHTGRQHQLRVHMAWLGYPLICDDRYGDPTPIQINTQNDRNPAIISRYALHACSLTFQHPNGNEMTIKAPLAQDMTDFLHGLRDNGKAELTSL